MSVENRQRALIHWTLSQGGTLLMPVSKIMLIAASNQNQFSVVA